MKKEDKEELLQKDVYRIKDTEIDDYIKKYVKLKRVNRAKLAAMALVPAITFGTIIGTIVGGIAGVNKPYDEVDNYCVRYVDKDTNVIIQDNTKEKDNAIITIKYPFEKHDNYYVRKISEFKTKDDVSNNVNDIINSNPDFIGDLVNLKNESTNYEVKKEIDPNDNNTEISVLYNEFLGKNKKYKSKDEKSSEVAATVFSTIAGLLGGGKISNELIDYNDFKFNQNYINSNIKTLKRRKKKEDS